jgi:tRNA G10  N-methylase Trm11
MRSAENCFVVAGYVQGVAGSRAKGIPRLSDLIQSIDLNAACRSVRPLRSDMMRAAITIQVLGKHEFEEKDLLPLIRRAFVKDHITESQSGFDYNIRLQVMHDQAFVGVQIPERSLKDRPYKKITRPGSLDPTVAYAMVHLLELSSKDTFVDPLCGAGTIVAEATLSFCPRLIIAADLDKAALAASRNNLSTFKNHLSLMQGNALSTPFCDSSIHKIASNLPYGKDIPLADPVAFIGQVLMEFSRIIAPKGRACLLTKHGELIELWLRQNRPFVKKKHLRLNLFGFDASLILLERTKKSAPISHF